MKTKNEIKILAVDDEQDICEIIKFNLESEEYQVDTAFSGEEALKLNLKDYDLFIFDIMMSGISGYKLAEEVRKTRKLDTPIIFLSAKTSENNKLTGFSLGADDYISKPFSMKELSARIQAVLRRVKPSEKPEESKIVIAELELDDLKKKMYIEGKKIDLTPHEYSILFLLIKNPGKIYSRDEILRIAWDNDTHVVDRTVDVHVTRLRKKMGEYGRCLISRSGYGYCFEIDDI
jgi:DNA-binding response OmpR family regulator